MSRSKRRLTTFYYAECSSPGDEVWDSDSELGKFRIANSPSQREWCEYVTQRQSEEKKYANWINKKMKNKELMENIEERSGWKVKMYKTKVWYFYKPTIGDERVKELSYKIKFEYVRFLRKWYVRWGGSSVPSCLELPSFTEQGTYDPTGSRVIYFLVETRKIIYAWVLKREYYQNFELMMETRYDKLKIIFETNFKKVTFKFRVKNGFWIPGHPKTSEHDSLCIEIKLNDDLRMEKDGIDYSYIHKPNLSRTTRQRLVQSLEERLRIFESLELHPAFEEFMTVSEPAEIPQLSSDDDSDESLPENELESYSNRQRKRSNLSTEPSFRSVQDFEISPTPKRKRFRGTDDESL